ncbi:MAG TPA: glutamate formimidoyltransferase [Thermoplasmata archaeon]|nr:glutamate formimidoyltransferase [Thermoplasmata archaeon]
MTPFECVPNFSEGRDAARIARLVDAARPVAGVTVLDTERNADHHRCVITLYGDGDALLDAVFRMMQVATAEIDLTTHRGEHPRMGATDVVPFVPLGAATMDEAVRLAERLGERVARELHVPVYLYARAARTPERADLAKVREGQFEGLREAVRTDPARAPDFGAPELHPTAGAVAIGARPILIAYNVYLSTPDVAVAKRIAKKVRARDGGLPEVKALGFEIRERNLAQVSMNLTDYRTTSIATAFDAVAAAASAEGVGIEESEIVGLVPADALAGAALHYLKLRQFDPALVLESKVAAVEAGRPGHESIASYGARLAARTPTPGGGSASSVVAALGTALGEMVLAYSIDPKAPDAELVALRASLGQERARFLELADADAAAYDAVRGARRAMKAAPGDPRAQAGYLEALRHAAGVPLEIAERARATRDRLDAVKSRTRTLLASDFVSAIAMLRAAAEGALANVAINLDDLKAAGAPTEEYERAIDRLRAPG